MLECASFLAGPIAAMMLADLGADVVKLEPREGEVARGVGPMAAPGVSTIFASGNRGKRSIALDLDSTRGQAIAADLAAASDVVLHNLSEPAAQRLGLTGPTLRQRSPATVTCAISAFGTTGPYAHATAIDPVIQAISGMMALTGERDAVPTRAGSQVVDVGAGITAAAAVLAALLGRERGGGGAEIDISLLDVGLMFNASFFPLRSVTGHDPPRLANRSHPLVADQFAVSDGFVVFGFWDERRWQRICRLLNREHWLERSEWSNNDRRLDDYEALRAELAAAVAQWRADDLVAALRAAGIAAGKTLSFSDVAVDPHVRAVGGLYTEDRFEQPVDLAAGALRIDGTRAVATEPAPSLGRHSAEVLRERLGLTDRQAEELLQSGVVAGPPGTD